jgi:hypothetical protein
LKGVFVRDAVHSYTHTIPVPDPTVGPAALSLRWQSCNSLCLLGLATTVYPDCFPFLVTDRCLASQWIGLAGLKPVPVRRPRARPEKWGTVTSIFPKAVINRALATQALLLFHAIILSLPERLFNVAPRASARLPSPLVFESVPHYSQQTKAPIEPSQH